MYVVHCKPYENTCMRLISKTQCILAIKYTAYQLNKMQLYNTPSAIVTSMQKVYEDACSIIHAEIASDVQVTVHRDKVL